MSKTEELAHNVLMVSFAVIAAAAAVGVAVVIGRGLWGMF